MAKKQTATKKVVPTSGDYEVGYGRPPKATQFQKGASGNPHGRPPGRRNLATDLTLALEEQVKVVENGKHRQITKREAICRQLANRSAAGDLAAMRLVIPLMAQLDASEAGEGSGLDLAQDKALAEALFERLRTLGSDSGGEEGA